MARSIRRFSRWSAVPCLLVLAACGELPDDPVPSTTAPTTRPAVAFRSTAGCQLDDDCAAGLHCFQNLCARACDDDSACRGDEVCTDRGRCADPASQAPSGLFHAQNAARVDATDERLLNDSGAVSIIDVFPSRVSVADGQSTASVTLTFDQPLPGGVLRYALGFHDQAGLSPLTDVRGKTSVTIAIPVAGLLSPDRPTLGVDIVTSAGRTSVVLARTLPVQGHYEGVVALTSVGGGTVPIAFSIEATPSHVTRLQDATSLSLLLPTDAAYVIGLPGASSTAGSSTDAPWLRRPLQWDPTARAWVATFAHAVDSRELFGSDAFPSVARSFRIELRESPDIESSFTGGLIDRWHGIRDKFSVDGVRQNGPIALQGTLHAAYAGSLPVVPVEALATVTPPSGPVPAPSLASCTDSDLARIPGPDDDTPSACQLLQSIAEVAFEDPALVSACALEMAELRNAAPSVVDDLHAFLDPERDNPYGMSFEEYLDACAEQRDGICAPSRQDQCARSLVAYAYRHADAASGDASALGDAYASLSQRVFVGSKLAAFHVDAANRLEWLRSAEAPLFLASALKDYNARILASWRTRVVDTLLDAVFGQLDDAGMAYLSRATNDQGLMALRAEQLLDIGVTWRAAADALSLYARRVHVLEDNDARRVQEAARLQRQFFRLYVAGALLADVGREAGTAYQNPSIGTYFSSLTADIARMRAPFSRLIFARQAAIVTSQSVDPSSNSRSLLTELRASALESVRAAERSVTQVLNEAQLNDVRGSLLETRYADQLVAMRNELITLCGLPTGCDADDVTSDPACRIQTDAQNCGFEQRRNGETLAEPSSTNVSDASVALLGVWEAFKALEIAEAQTNAKLAQLTLQVQAADAFADSILARQNRRTEVAAEIRSIERDIQRLNNARLTDTLRGLQQQQTLRERAYAQQAAAVENWSRILRDGVASDMRLIDRANHHSMNAEILNYSADRAKTAADYVSKSLQDKTTAVFKWMRAIPLGVGYGVSTALGAAAVNQDIVANSMEAEMEKGDLADAQYETEMRDLEDLNARLTATDIARLESDMQAVNLRTDAEIAASRAMIDVLQRTLAFDEAYDRDLMELRDRRDRILLDAQGLGAMDYQSHQADITVSQHVLAYLQIVQRAQLLQARFDSAQQRWSNIHNILGSPDVIFSFSNRIALAESRLDAARESLQEWLSALEYYAVRPFVSQRLAILLARNPQQLEAIAHELERLQSVCGGPVTQERVVVSLRDDLLQLNVPSAVQSDEGITIAQPAQRLRTLLQRASTPVARQARINAHETVGQRLARGNVLAANFRLSAHDFANLPQTCNAKVASIAVELVGFDGVDAQPVVTVLYDGSSQLRSCQANIREVVAAVGVESTPFAPVTFFETGARAISPVAGIGGFGAPKTWNATLEGTPLAAGYTVLIDLEHPSNQAIDWSKLEDIRLQFAYSYQDVFPEGQCE